MLDLLRGSPSLEGALEERDAEIATLQAQIKAYQEADQRDFLADNSDQLASIISTKNQVIHDLQLQLDRFTAETAPPSGPSVATSSMTMAQALESAKTSAAEVERLRRKLKEQQHQLQLYREENHRQAGELAANAAKSAVEIGTLQAQLKSFEEMQVEVAKVKSGVSADGELNNADSSVPKEIPQVHVPNGGGHSEGQNQQPPPAEATREEIAQFQRMCAERMKALEAREAAAAQLEAMLEQQGAQNQQVQEGMNVLAERESKVSTREAEFEQLCAERMKALEAREAAAAQLEAMLEQQGAQNQQVEEGMNGLAERESKVSTREAEFEQLCAERMKALEAREAQLARASLGDGLTAELAALEGREKECTEREKALEVREAATAADAKVHGCFYQELDEQKQLLAEREQAALEQEALLEKREQAIEESESKLELQKKELQRLEDGLRKRETLCAEQEKEGRRASAAAAATAKEARLGAQASRQVEQVQQNLATASTKMAARSISNLEAGVTGGGVAGAIAALLQDVELGERSGVSLVDLGLSDIAGLPEADKFMQLLSALMAVRADARLIVFGLWLLCHLIYVLYLIYAHAFR